MVVTWSSILIRPPVTMAAWRLTAQLLLLRLLLVPLIRSLDFQAMVAMCPILIPS
jgi:hypothetical protein